ncbi:antirestriction protein [Bilophila wadsworthia]|uniref:antirestriction protein n=1 Tax=Bilophila wadsworthia TaxID=35833 RepID=UPI00242CB1D5|nr:antirestriction protein [Bilophila wadsworthia]
MQSGYPGGFWNFYDLSNGCFSIAPELPHPMRLMRLGSFFDGEMSPDVAGRCGDLVCPYQVRRTLSCLCRELQADLRVYRLAP